jgi:hypothetical protein
MMQAGQATVNCRESFMNFEILPLRGRTFLSKKNGSNFDMTKIFGAIAIIGLVLAIVAHSNPVLTGVGKAIFGVFFILVFLSKLGDYWIEEKPETTHDHGGLMGKGGHGHH